MSNKKTINLLCILIVTLAIFASLVGVFSSDGAGTYEMLTFRGETALIYGKGLYKLDTVIVASQGIAQDVVTLLVGIPLLLLSLLKAQQGALKPKLLLMGTLGYFLYTYVSYVFLWMYNPLFIVYIIIMSASFFAFVLLITSIDTIKLKNSFNDKTPTKFLGGFQIFFAFVLFMMWSGKIMMSLRDGSVPVGLDHYTTLVIQGLDLGFIVPVAVLSGVLLIQKKPLGYLLSSVVIMKGFTMGIAITAMVIGQLLAGVSMALAEIIIFPVFSIALCFCLFLLLKNIDETKYSQQL